MLGAKKLTHQSLNSNHSFSVVLIFCTPAYQCLIIVDVSAAGYADPYTDQVKYSPNFRQQPIAHPSRRISLPAEIREESN